MRARVATYNIRHAEALDGRVDFDAVAVAIRALGAELVAVQELDRGARRSGGADQPALVENALRLPVHFAPTVRLRDGGDYGIALAASGVTQVDALDLPRAGDEEPRACLVAQWGDTVAVATHLARQRRARILQLRFLADLVSGIGSPVVLLGDLNAGPGELGPLLEAGLDPGAGLAATFPARRPGRQIDWVLAGGGAAVVSARVGGGPSDHLPLIADVALPGPPKTDPGL